MTLFGACGRQFSNSQPLPCEDGHAAGRDGCVAGEGETWRRLSLAENTGHARTSRICIWGVELLAGVGLGCSVSRELNGGCVLRWLFGLFTLSAAGFSLWSRGASPFEMENISPISVEVTLGVHSMLFRRVDGGGVLSRRSGTPLGRKTGSRECGAGVFPLPTSAMLHRNPSGSSDPPSQNCRGRTGQGTMQQRPN